MALKIRISNKVYLFWTPFACSLKSCWIFFSISSPFGTRLGLDGWNRASQFLKNTCVAAINFENFPSITHILKWSEDLHCSIWIYNDGSVACCWLFVFCACTKNKLFFRFIVFCACTTNNTKGTLVHERELLVFLIRSLYMF